MNHAPYLRLAAAIVLLAPLLAACGQSQPPGRRAAACAGGDGGEADRARRHRPGRICRPLRRGGFGRGSRPRLGLSRPDPFPRRPDGQAGRPAVHHRQAPVPEHSRADAQAPWRRPRPISLSPRPTSSAPSSSCATAPSPSRPSTSAPRPSARRTASVAANEAAVRQAELDLEFTELRAPVAGRIGDRRVSPRQSRHRRRRRHHHDARHHRLARPDPFRIHHG